MTAAFALAATGLAGVTAAPAPAATSAAKPAAPATSAPSPRNLSLADVVDYSAQVVRVVDVKTREVVATVPVGPNPIQAVASPDNHTSYVVGTSGTVTVIDTATSTATRTFPVCKYATGEAVKPDGSQLWVGCATGVISVVDLATAAVVDTISVPYGNIDGLTFTQGGATVLAEYGFGTVAGMYVIDTGSYAITSTVAQAIPDSGAIATPDASTFLFAQTDTDSVAIVDAADDTVTATVPVGGVPDRGTMNPAGTAAYYCVTKPDRSSDIVEVDLAAKAVTQTMADSCDGRTDLTDHSLFADPDGRSLWSLQQSGGFIMIDTTTGQVVYRIGAAGSQLVDPVSMGFLQYPLAPRITSLDQPQGPDYGGVDTQVFINGGPFLIYSDTSIYPDPIQVYFGGVPAYATINSDEQISADAPPHMFGTVTVTVTTDNGTTAIGPTNQYTYIQTPELTDMTPATGVSSGGTTVVLTGRDLGTTTSVYFGGTAASSFTIDSDTQVTAVTRAQHNGRVPVTITNATGHNNIFEAFYFRFVSPVPIVTSVSPPSGPTAGGTTVTITGTRFTGTFRVAFGGVAVPYTLVSDSEITVVTPPWASAMRPVAGTSPTGPGGQVDVTVTTDVATSDTSSADVYDYTSSA